MASKHMKSFQKTLMVKEMLFKTTMRNATYSPE